MKVPKGWRLHELGEIVDITSGGTPNKQTPEYWGGEIPWLSAKDLKTLCLSTSIEKVSAKGAVNGTRYVPTGGLLILTRGMTLFKDVPVGYATKPITFNQDLKGMVPKENVDGLYLAWSLTASKHRLMRLVDHAGHGTGRLSTDLLSIEPVLVPPLPEQRRIAEILGSWDRTIEMKQNLVAAKITRLRSLRHQILTGNKRFPEFKGKWKAVRLDDLLVETERYVTWEDNDIYNLVSVRRRSGGLFQRGSLRGKEIKTKVMKTIHEGDFLIARMQAVHGATAVVQSTHHGMHVSDSYNTLRARNQENLDINFLGWLSTMPQFYRLVLMSSHGVVIEKMTFDLSDFLKRYITIPPTRVEQTRIATFLKACQREIVLLTTQLEALKQQKRGMMQKLLTGEVRVKV